MEGREEHPMKHAAKARRNGDCAHNDTHWCAENTLLTRIGYA